VGRTGRMEEPVCGVSCVCCGSDDLTRPPCIISPLSVRVVRSSPSCLSSLPTSWNASESTRKRCIRSVSLLSFWAKASSPAEALRPLAINVADVWSAICLMLLVLSAAFCPFRVPSLFCFGCRVFTF
jgi:hypothetical protein